MRYVTAHYVWTNYLANFWKRVYSKRNGDMQNNNGSMFINQLTFNNIII